MEVSRFAASESIGSCKINHNSKEELTFLLHTVYSRRYQSYNPVPSPATPLGLQSIHASIQVHHDVDRRDQDFSCDEDDNDPFEVFAWPQH